MAGFAAALKGLMGLSDSSYKAQQEFLQTDWFNRKNLQNEQIGNVNMEVARAGVQNQAANLALQRQTEERLAREAALRLRASQNTLDEALRNQEISRAEREGYPTAGSPNMLLQNVAPTEQAPTSITSVAGGAPIATAPTQAPAVVATPSVQVSMPSRGAGGPATPVQNLGPSAPVQTQVPPPPTAVAPAEQAPIRTQAGTQYRQTPPITVTQIQPVRGYTIPSATMPDGTVRPARTVTLNETIGWENNFINKINEWEKLATSPGMTPNGTAAFIDLINREAEQFSRNLGGMREEPLDHVTGVLTRLHAIHPTMVQNAVRADEDRAALVNTREAELQNLREGYGRSGNRLLNATELRAYGLQPGARMSDIPGSELQATPTNRAASIRSLTADLTGFAAAQIKEGVFDFGEAQDKLERDLAAAVASNKITQEESDGINGTVILNILREMRASATAGRAANNAANTGGGSGGDNLTPTQARAAERAREAAATNTRSSLNEMSSIARTMTDNGINVQHIITDVRPETMSEQDWKLLRTRWLRGVWKSNPTNPEYPSGWRASVGG